MVKRLSPQAKSGKLKLNAHLIFGLGLLLSVSGFANAQTDVDQVGADAGSFSVDNSGIGSWSVPIETPPGIRGLAPKLTLGISTSKANGPVGQGGVLSGASSISRCTKTIASDGTNSKIDIDATDEYCLDGNRLILIAGTHGAAGSEYRTEIESFQRIIANGSAGGAGPASFTVTSRSGTQMTYGGGNSSVLYHTGAVLNWRISQLQDTSGNYMDYAYSNDPAESVLYEINYGGNTNANQDHFLKVKLVYEPRPDQSTGYSFGQLGQSTKRLSNIQTYADGELVRNYHLSYALNEVSGQSRLSQFQECAVGDEGEVCLAPTTFDYTPENDNWTNSSASIPTPTQGPDGQPYGLTTDINNDGWQDWLVSVRYSDGSVNNQTWLGSETGFSSDINWQLPAILYDYQLHADGLGTAQLVDVNGDGYLDVIEAYQTASGITKNVWLNSGSGFNSTSQFVLPDVFFSTVNLARGETRLRFAELNGDGLADALVYTRDRTDTTTRKAWINNGTGWVEDSDWLPKQILSDYKESSYPGEYEHATLADINGDGLADYVQAVFHGSTGNNDKLVWLNTGNGWELDSGYAPPIELLDYAAHQRGHPKGRLVDLNGDGLLDIAQAITRADNSTVSNAWLNTGEGWLSAPWWALPASMARYKADGHTDMLGVMMDLNGDGKPEFVQSYQSTTGATIFNAWEHNGVGWLSSNVTALPAPLFKHHSNGSSTSYAQIADIDSDGVADIFTAQSGLSNTVYTHPATVAGEVAGFLRQITNGLGLETKIHYANSNDDAVYIPATLSPWPNIANNANRILIQSSKISNGLGGWNEAFHQYSEAKVNVTGRGSLGFASHSAADGRSGIQITTEFYQNFPFAGMVKASSNKTQSGTVLSSSSSTPEQRNLNGGKTIFAYAKSSVSNDYDLHTGAWIQTKQLTTTQDDYGNTIESTEIVSNTNGEQLTTERFVTPDLDLVSWILDKTSSTTETISQPGKPSHTSTVVHSEYYPNTNLLKTEVLEPSLAHSLTSTYEYDVFGNRTKTTISPTTSQTPALAPRETITNFIHATGRKDGRFPLSVTNTLNHTAYSEYDGRYGKPTLVTDANGVKKKYYYNAFGVQLNETVLRENEPEPSGKDVAIPHWCTAQNECPENAVYFIAALDNQREAPEAAYYDAYGREIRRQTHGMGGAVIYQDTEYDAYGRKAKVSNHYFKGQENLRKWKETLYDVLDRPTQVTMPDNGVTTYTYDGLTTTVNNALDQDTEVIKNILGKPKQSTDDAINSTDFTYDVRGNLLTTTDSAGNQIINTYDHFGRKQTMDDPDMGYWQYFYDAFGQMTSQLDAKGQTVAMAYDVLGRLKTRTELEGQTSWTYDSAANGKGKLASVSSPGYSRALEYDTLGRVDKSTIITSGKSYATEFGYQGVLEKVDWVKYPTGLVVHKDYDDYGFPKELESVDLAKYKAYRNKLDEANDYYRQAMMLEEQHKDEYEALKAFIDPYFERINAAYNSAAPYLDLINKTHKKELQHYDLADAYDTEYLRNVGHYNNHIAEAEADMATANTYYTSYEDHERLALRDYYPIWKDYMHRGCANMGSEAYSGECAGIGPGPYAPPYYDLPTALNWFNAAAPYGTEYERLMGIAQTKYNAYVSYINRANDHYDDAAAYEEELSIYGAQVGSHTNIQLAFQTRREGYEDDMVQYFGRWANRADAGNDCIKWAKDDEYPDTCVTELGAYQIEWDALTEETALYNNGGNMLTESNKVERYEYLLGLIEDMVEQGDIAKGEADALYDEYKNNATIYWTALDADANGQITRAEYGNGVESNWTYDEMGRMGTIKTTTPYTDTIQTSSTIQNELYEFDSLGNLDYRHDLAYDFKEDFEYDTLNRLTQSVVSGTGASLYAAVGLTAIDLSYDALGNITNKSDVTGQSSGSYYSYGQNNAGPHAVTHIGGSKNTTFTYDANGNQLTGNGRTITYTSFNKPDHVSKAGNVTDMTYGPGRELIRQVETTDGQTTTTTYIGGLYEELEKDGSTKAKHHLTIAGQAVAVIQHDVLGTPQAPSYEYDDTHYLHKDHLNSITAITDQDGKLVERFHYDAFGQRRTAIAAPYTNLAAAGIFPITSRGYTGHKQMAGTDLIHMGGRVYDPEVGRFLSADPHIQSPLNTQSLNRYSYVNNNPLSFTDPSGYFLSKLFKGLKKLFKKIAKMIKKVLKAIVKAVKVVAKVVKKVVKAVKKYARVIATVAVAVIAPYAVAAIASGAGILATGTVALSTMSAGMTIAAGAIGGGLAGLVSTGTLKGMLIGAVSGAAFAGIGNFYKGQIASNFKNGISTLKNGLTTAQSIGRVILHGVAGGVRSVLSGGKFKVGFVSAGFTQVAAPAIGLAQSDAGQAVAAGIVGGIGSELVGGEFEDGFITGLFSHAFNSKLHENSVPISETDRILAQNATSASGADRNIYREAFWEGRWVAGDPLADTALAIVQNTGLNGKTANWLAKIGGATDLEALGVDLINAHIAATDRDTYGIPYNLGTNQIRDYHHSVFDDHGISPWAYGGKPGLGWIYCPACDADY